MFVMLSVRTTSVCERHNKVTTTTTTTANTTTSKATNTYSTHTTQSQDSAISSLTTQFDNLLINKNSIEKIFTKSVSFDKNINQSNLSLTQPNNLKEPPAQQVIYKLHPLSWIYAGFVHSLGNRSFNCVYTIRYRLPYLTLSLSLFLSRSLGMLRYLLEFSRYYLVLYSVYNFKCSRQSAMFVSLIANIRIHSIHTELHVISMKMGLGTNPVAI